MKHMIMRAAVVLLAVAAGACRGDMRRPDTHVPFVENRGQYPRNVRYWAKVLNTTVFITEESHIVYALPVQEKAGAGLRRLVLRERFVNGAAVEAEGVRPVDTRVNIFSHAGQGITPSVYETLSMKRIFPKVDLDLQARDGNVEKIYRVAPGGNPEDIELSLEGGSSLTLDADGRLVVASALGTVAFSAPVAYQTIDGLKKTVDVTYELRGAERYGFLLGVYDAGHELVIDPLLAATYVGGSGDDESYEPLVAVGPDGNVYFSGSSNSVDYPVTSGVISEGCRGAMDRVVSIYTPDLSTLLASTYIGGTGEETGQGLDFDREGNVCIAGYTSSSNFPVTDQAYDKSFNGGGRDVFVAKLSPDLSMLLAATYLGGRGDEGPQSPRIDLACAADGSIYVAALTGSSDLPTLPGSHDKTFGGGGQDVFVARLNAELSELEGLSYVGGYTDEWRPNLQLDSQGNVFVAGSTRQGFPTTSGAYGQTYFGDYYDMFIAKFNADLTDLLAATYLGSNGSEDCIGLKVDDHDNVYAVGYTTSPAYPVSSSAYDRSFNGNFDMVVTLMSGDLSQVMASTFLGGSSFDTGQDIDLAPNGDVVVVGTSKSYNFPVCAHAYDSSCNSRSGGNDVVLARVSADLSTLHHATYYGGGQEQGKCVRVSGDRIYVAGKSESGKLPTAALGHDQSANGGLDSFIACFDGTLDAVTTAVESPDSGPEDFKLLGNYPNPFNPVTTVKFSLPQTGPTRLRVFDSNGRQTAILIDEMITAGFHEVHFDASELASGAYICRLEYGGKTMTKKMILSK